jgi:hypothetical protein
LRDPYDHMSGKVFAAVRLHSLQKIIVEPGRYR